MFELVDWIPGLVRRGLEALTGWSPGELQAWLDAVNAAGTWELLRIWLVNPQLLLIWLVSALVVERWFPARPRQAWLNPYQLLDFLYPLLRSFVTLSIRPAGYVFFLSFYQTFLPFLNTGFLDDRPAPWQALGAFLAYDLASWGSHWLRHKVPWFWHFHTIHHSQRHLNPFSVHREHPATRIFICS